MNKLFNQLIFLALNFFMCVPGHGQTRYPVSEHTKKVIDSTYNAWIKKYQVIGLSLAIVDNGQIVYASGYGFSDKAKMIRADERTVYRIGSCTKSFTALSLLQLQERNRISIGNSVKVYLPELTISSRFNDNNEIYINDMLCHVSGLPCDIRNGFFCDSPPDINWVIGELNKQTTMSPHRYKHAYSNTAYGLLGEVIARAGKTTYSDYVKNNVFIPLGMSSSYIINNEALAANCSKAYVNKKEIKEPMIRDQAAGLIHSNAMDMANYLTMFLNRGKFNGVQILSEQSISEMEKNQLGNTLLSHKGNWGYGLYLKSAMVVKDKDSAEIKIIGHGGDTYAFHADFAYIPGQNVGVVILTNTDKGTSINNASSLLRIYLKEEKGIKLDTKYVPIETDTCLKGNKQEYTGNEITGLYNFGPYLMKVTNPEKMSFRQGPGKIIFTQKKSDPQNYKPKAFLFGIIPVKIKNQEITFVKLNNEMYLKAINTKTKREDYLAVKTNPVPLPASWKDKAGNYKAVGVIYACKDCPFTNPEGLSLKLSVNGDQVRMDTKAKSADMKSTYFLTIISDKLAVTGGIGRGTGEAVTVLENGNIYYSGFEFSKVK